MARRKTSSRSTKPSANGALKKKKGMSRASRVALASAAAGVIAATAAGLASTRKGREVTRKVSRQIKPMINDRLTTIVDTVEASLAEYGLLEVIPANVRAHIHARLGSGAGGRTPDMPQRPSTTRRRKGKGHGKSAHS